MQFFFWEVKYKMVLTAWQGNWIVVQLKHMARHPKFYNWDLNRDHPLFRILSDAFVRGGSVESLSSDGEGPSDEDIRVNFL